MAEMQNQGMNTAGGSDGNEVLETLGTQEYEQELALCLAAGGDIDTIRGEQLDLYQLTEVRKGLQSRVDVRKYMSASIPWMQMEELRLEMEQHVDMSKYRKNGYARSQIAEIREGLAKGLDVSEYDRKDFFSGQMREIRIGLQEGLPVIFYKDPQYDWMQMAEIRMGLETNMDISLYARIDIPYLKMQTIRKSLADGLTFTRKEIDSYSVGILEQMRQAYLQAVDIREYVILGYDADQLEQIRIALSEKLDISCFLFPEMRGESMQEIQMGLEEGIDVSVYANMNYNWQQMREIRKGLENRVDVSVYAKPLYLSQQMREIRKGLESGLDVSKFSSMSNTPAEMYRIRKKLEAGEPIISPAETAYNQLSEAEDHQMRMGLGSAAGDTQEKKNQSQEHYLRVSEDRMKCFLRLPKPVKGKSYTLDFILMLLGKAGVLKGVNRKSISDMLLNEIYELDTLVAQGKEPVDGKNGYYEYFFDREIPSPFHVMEDGTVDFADVKLFENVKVGDCLAEYHRATQGTDGYNVNGDILQGKNGREMPILKGRGFMLLPDNKYCAAVSGVVKLSGNELNINRLLILKDVQTKDRPIDFGGSVWIEGDVEPGASIHALGDLVIDGSVNNAVISAEGDILIKQGASGTAPARIDAGGQLTGKYFAGIEIHTKKDLVTNSCLNCKIFSEGNVICHGEKGTIYGGELQTLLGLKTAILGNEQNTRTFVSLGITAALEIQYKENSRQIDKVREQLEVIRKERKRLTSMKLVTREQLQWKIKINVATGMKEKELVTLEQEKENLEEEIKKVSGACAVVSHMVYAGTVLKIDGMVVNISTNREEKNGIIFRKENRSVYAMEM